MWLARSPGAGSTLAGIHDAELCFDCRERLPNERREPPRRRRRRTGEAHPREPRAANRDRAASVTTATAEQFEWKAACSYADSVRVDPAMPDDDGLDRLSSQELHDLAVHRAKRHLDARFFYQLMKLLPVAEAGAGEFEKSENDIMRLSAHVDDVTDSGRGEVAELMRPFYLEYLRKHRVTADAS
jgi:hypothetical protein